LLNNYFKLFSIIRRRLFYFCLVIDLAFFIDDQHTVGVGRGIDHIDHGEHLRLLKEFHRALTGDGVAFVFEHNPLNPLTVRAVNTCPFDENARLIGARAMQSRLLAAGFKDARVRYRIFFPNALRALRPAEKWLTWLPLGAQYYVMATK
jgi:hypothetical protein